MKKTNKKGFTIVELVIVIAVIAVLAAVLIPTFSGIIEKANLSNDTSLVASINTAIAVEQVVSGDPNDAIEIAKIIKEYGMKLETKSKGNYLWYDIEKGKVILAGLGETGIVLNDAGANARSTKGQFKEAPSCPEDFVEGYLFITEESKDGLADAIYALRNPKGDNEEEIKKSLGEALEDIKKHGNENLYGKLNNFMLHTAVMTEHGTFTCENVNSGNVNKVIVSTEMTAVTQEAINGLAAYNNIIVVDFHSDVTEIASEVVEMIADEGNEVFFVYNNAKIGAIDKANGGDIFKLITREERPLNIHTLVLNYVNIADPESEPFFQDHSIEFSGFELKYQFPHLYYGGDDQAYDFECYSLYRDASNLIEVGKDGLRLDEAEEWLGDVNLYAFFSIVEEPDFKVADKLYSSKTVTQALANNALLTNLLNGTKTITVTSTKATLDAALIGLDSAELTLPQDIELLLPFQADGTKQASKDLIDGSGDTAYKAANYVSDAKYDKATMDGKTQLTIAKGVTLNNQGFIYVDAQLYYDGTYTQCYITDNCGVLVVGGTITSTGSITAYGVIRGEGTINATGGTVTEVMTVYDWYGGTNAVNAVGAATIYKGKTYTFSEGHGVTPFNNWKVEHIRTTMTVNSAVLYKAHAAIYVSGTKAIDFELTSGNPSQNPLFLMDGNAIIERSLSENGNAKFTIKQGGVVDTKKQLIIPDIVSKKINIIITSITLSFDAVIDFSTISLPLSHFDVNVASGAKLTISNNLYKVMPGSNITVDQGGTLNIGKKVVVCNSFDLTNQTSSDVALPHKYPVSLDADGKPIGATLVVNGTLNFENGASFAGDITSNVEEAKIIVADGVTVGGASFPEGYHISGSWYDAKDANLYTTPVLEGVVQSSLTGTYKSQLAGEIDGKPFYKWTK